MEVLAEHRIGCWEDYTDDRSSHLLIESAPETGDSYFVWPILATGEEEEPFELGDELREWRIALPNSIKVKIGTLYELMVFKKYADVPKEAVQGLDRDGTSVRGMEPHPRKDLALGLAFESPVRVPYLGIGVSDGWSVDVKLGLQFDEEWHKLRAVRVIKLGDVVNGVPWSSYWHFLLLSRRRGGGSSFLGVCSWGWLVTDVLF